MVCVFSSDKRLHQDRDQRQYDIANDSGQKTLIHMLPILPDQSKRKNHNGHGNRCIEIPSRIAMIIIVLIKIVHCLGKQIHDKETCCERWKNVCCILDFPAEMIAITFDQNKVSFTPYTNRISCRKKTKKLQIRVITMLNESIFPGKI